MICAALWGYASWSTMGLTLPSDLFPQDVVATVTGLVDFAGWVDSEDRSPYGSVAFYRRVAASTL
jgi:hypothetical protein